MVLLVVKVLDMIIIVIFKKGINLLLSKVLLKVVIWFLFKLWVFIFIWLYV